MVVKVRNERYVLGRRVLRNKRKSQTISGGWEGEVFLNGRLVTVKKARRSSEWFVVS